MEAQDLSRFSPLAELEPGALAAIAAVARRLRIPAGRWLVRPGRTLSGHFYLLDGRVRLLDRGRAAVVNAGSSRARRPIYPGATAVQTITSCVVISVATDSLEAVRGADGVPGLPEVASEDRSWQLRFLTSPLLQSLAPLAWQRLLRAMTPLFFETGDQVITAGAAADDCFVLCAGRAEILAPSGARLAHLEPGRLFGEDALITGGARNATVVMRSTGRAVRLPAQAFRCWLLDAVAAPLPVPGGRRLLSLDAQHAAALPLDLREVRSAGRRLEATCGYAVVGGRLAERQLAAFLLAEQGIDARPLSDPP